MKEEYSVLHFSEAMKYYSYFGIRSVEYIGGQNKSLIVVCRESYLNRNPFRRIIDSYAPIPPLARIDPSVITEVAKAANDHSFILLQISSILDKPVKVLNLTFTDLSFNETICNYIYLEK